ncbi:TetR/AcrR family transcriptional regulator [Pseudonocardia acaciae]|uniref:TetR/AcrR family transcriptional regulator n=1 Tax=Pseudonocardia acaciae TaxID=551276 RepID=UPI000688BD23|nr:TetR family transcriptional regulator [Pseudonocardia acaciae]
MSGRRLNRDDWTAEALRALRGGGLAAVAIEPLAARLGATKGSGYWHFRGRDDLIAATVARWEAEHTEAVIAHVESEAAAIDRLRELLRVVLGHVGPFTVELALLASADHPLVAPTLRRVTRRRLDYLTALFTELGFDPARSRRRAMLAYTTYLGHAQLARTDPAAVPAGEEERRAYLESVLAALLAPDGHRT